MHAGDLQAAFEALDDEIVDLVEARMGCRKAILVSRAAMVAGGLTLALAWPLPALRSPLVALAALTATIGGMVWAGASRASADEIRLRLAEAEARKSELFDEIASRNGWRDATPTLH